MNGRTPSGEGINGLSADSLAGHDAIAVSGRGRMTAAGIVHATPATLGPFNIRYAAFRTDRGIPPGYALDPKKAATGGGRAIAGAEHRPHFFRALLRFLAKEPDITVETAVGSYPAPSGLVEAFLSERGARYKLANSTGVAIIRGDLAGAPRTELTGLTIPRAIDPEPLEALLEIARLIAYLARDRHFPNPHRGGLGAILDELLPGITHHRF
ncbi:hypothetical protein ACWC5F_11710 [Streptomyces sp. NPDC001272]